MIRPSVSVASALCLVVLAACAEAPPPEPATPPAVSAPKARYTPASIEAAPADKQEAPKPKAELPTRCAEGSPARLCLPDKAFVERLCGGSYPDVALVMFHKKSPWTRGYVTRAIDAWNTASSLQSASKLSIDEEVILVKKRDNPGGMVVSGASGGFEALRWDGTCVSLGGDEVRMHPNGTPKAAPIPWRKLDDRTQHALLDDPRVKESYELRKKECQGASTPAQCDRAESALSRGIVGFVRNGGAVPSPSSRP